MQYWQYNGKETYHYYNYIYIQGRVPRQFHFKIPWYFPDYPNFPWSCDKKWPPPPLIVTPLPPCTKLSIQDTIQSTITSWTGIYLHLCMLYLLHQRKLIWHNYIYLYSGKDFQMALPKLSVYVDANIKM